VKRFPGVSVLRRPEDTLSLYQLIFDDVGWAGIKLDC
jgi:hypothetical protein